MFTQVLNGLCKKCCKIVIKTAETDLVPGVRSIVVLNSVYSGKVLRLC